MPTNREFRLGQARDHEIGMGDLLRNPLIKESLAPISPIISGLI